MIDEEKLREFLLERARYARKGERLREGIPHGVVEYWVGYDEACLDVLEHLDNEHASDTKYNWTIY